METTPTKIYTLSLHDALPIFQPLLRHADAAFVVAADDRPGRARGTLGQLALAREDRKSTRLNSSHRCISYAVFCLKKKIKKLQHHSHFYLLSLYKQTYLHTTT